jgi:hypothetical protein
MHGRSSVGGGFGGFGSGAGGAAGGSSLRQTFFVNATYTFYGSLYFFEGPP